MWKEYELGELLLYEQPTPYIVASTEYDDTYKTPVLTAGKSFIIGYTDETEGIYEALPVIIFDDFTTATQYVNFPFKVKSSAMKILTANEDLVLPKFIYYRMQIINLDHSTHKRYWIQQYSKLKVAIPSISEQERIVARIEELFSQLDKAVETLQVVKEQLVVYRQAVLKDAFEGVLTNSEKIQTVNLASLIEKPRYGTSKKCTYNKTETAVPVYRIPNINHYVGTVNHSDLKYAEFSNSEFEALTLNEGDLLLIRSNGSASLVGRAAIVNQKDLGGTFAGYLIRVRIKDCAVINPKYLLLYLQSFEARCYIENKAKSTSGVHNINSEEISELKVPLFEIGEQDRIIEAIEVRLSIYDKISETVESILNQAEAMRQSILKQAFEGKLVQC